MPQKRKKGSETQKVVARPRGSFYNDPEDRMDRFQNLLLLYKNMHTLMSAICAKKGGIDIDNYSGKYFLADVLELLVAYGEKAGVDITALRAEFERKKEFVTPTVKPIYEMTLVEFEKMIGGSVA